MPQEPLAVSEPSKDALAQEPPKDSLINQVKEPANTEVNKSSMFGFLHSISLLPAVILLVFILLLSLQATVVFNRNTQMDELVQSLQKTQATLESQLVTLNSQVELMKLEN